VETRVVDVAGYATSYTTGGDGPPLLHLHAETTSGWGPLDDALADRFTVHAPVHPGCGGSPLPDWVAARDAVAYHSVDVLDALGLDEPVLVVGESIGGWMGLALGVQRPDRLAGLVLVGALGLRPATPMPDLFIKPGPEVLRTLSDRLDADRVDPLEGDAEAATALWLDQAAQARLMWERPYEPKLRRRAHHLRGVPSQVVWGAADRLLPPEHGRELAELLGAGYEVVPGAGHLVALDAPDAVAAIVTAFWEDRS
jgi:pimeloyl-ACP methyl ester carboxylesterase